MVFFMSHLIYAVFYLLVYSESLGYHEVPKVAFPSVLALLSCLKKINIGIVIPPFVCSDCKLLEPKLSLICVQTPKFYLCI